MSIYQPFFRRLHDANVHYVIVGGLATVLHGYARFTADIDLVINLNKAEAEKAVKAIVGMGLKPRLPVDPLQFADSSIRESWRKEKGMEVFSFYDPNNPMLTVDLFVHEPIPFDKLASRSERMDIDGVIVQVCSIEDLIELKKRVGRHKDMDDIDHLREILRIRDKNEEEKG